MAMIIPITLVGDNLGKRHLYLKTLVNETHKRGEDFDVIKNIPEQSPIDRLFKIDLAYKIKHVEYIIQNLKDEDMLYVSRALKSTWLVEPKFENIINPQHLEGHIYPEMITTAVTKMQHWIHHNLNDEVRCLQFYQYYYEKNFELAIKFLVKCSVKDIQEEFPKIMYKIDPHYFKVLCEKCSLIAKIFFDSIPIDNELKNQYLKDENAYFVTVKHLLKTNTDLVLDVTEKYFNTNMFNRFSEQQTKFIMNHHKKRFLQKPELYTGWILNMDGIADSLKSDEAKDLVLKLARAQYLTSWFSYQSVEPLIKRLKPDERAEFKKIVFVTKNIGEIEEDWPYKTPEPPAQEIDYVSIFDDPQPEPNEYSYLGRSKKRKILKKCVKREYCEIMEECCSAEQRKTLLDQLFDEYRFASFSKTLYELRKRIMAESSSQNRQFMMLVLVSKSGGRPDAIASLLELLARQCNEPANVRAAIIRSLVKRASVWSVPENTWNQLLEFGQGLGLDGNTPDADCNEGLHAVVIRSLLTGKCKPLIQKAFLAEFSTLTEYSLTTTEKSVIAIELPKILLSLAKEKEEKEELAESVGCIDKLIDTLNAYKIKVETYPELIDTIIKLAEKDKSETTYLINRLFDAKIGRRQLFPYTFGIVKTDASYLNALKHDITILNAQNFAEYITQTIIVNANKFLTKLSVYFGEENGLANTFLNELKSKDCDKVLGRPLAILLKDQLECYIQNLDVLEDNKFKLLASVIRANEHLARPALNIDVFGWKKAGAKLVATRVLKCQSVKIDTNIKELLKCKRTAKLALTLSNKTTYETEVFVKLAKLRPTIAIKSGLKLIKLHGDKVDPLIWGTIKIIIQELDMTKNDRTHLVRSLAAIEQIPAKIKSEYSTVIYKAFKKIYFYKAMPPLCHIEILLPDVDEEFIENLLVQYLNDDFTVEKLSTETNDIKCTCLYIRILVKYIFLSKSEEMQKRKMETFLDIFLAKMEEIKNSEKKELFSDYFSETLLTFKNTKVFLDTQYVSPLPVMEKVVVWMQKFFSIHEHFNTFAQIHLSMLYFKAVRQCSTLAPEIFIDEKRKRKEGVAVVGNLFGKYIAREVNNLKTKYFDSIPELYLTSLLSYLETFNYSYVSNDLLSSIVKGILEESKGSEYRLGIYLLQERRYYITDEQSQEIKKYVNEIEDKETKWFSSAYL